MRILARPAASTAATARRMQIDIFYVLLVNLLPHIHARAKSTRTNKKQKGKEMLLLLLFLMERNQTKRIAWLFVCLHFRFRNFFFFFFQYLKLNIYFMNSIFAAQRKISEEIMDQMEIYTYYVSETYYFIYNVQIYLAK